MLDEQHQHFSLHMDTGTSLKTALNPTPGRVNSNYGQLVAELSAAGSSASCLGRKKPRRSRWFEAQPSRVAQTFMKDSKFDAHEVAFGEYQTRSWRGTL